MVGNSSARTTNSLVSAFSLCFIVHLLSGNCLWGVVGLDVLRRVEIS